MCTIQFHGSWILGTFTCSFHPILLNLFYDDHASFLQYISNSFIQIKSLLFVLTFFFLLSFLVLDALLLVALEDTSSKQIGLSKSSWNFREGRQREKRDIVSHMRKRRSDTRWRTALCFWNAAESDSDAHHAMWCRRYYFIRSELILFDMIWYDNVTKKIRSEYPTSHSFCLFIRLYPPLSSLPLPLSLTVNLSFYRYLASGRVGSSSLSLTAPSGQLNFESSVR